jgi:outer membrane protein TolC
MGQAPADFSLAADHGASPHLPQIPAQLPSQLLERRPDIAAAERSVMAANANIGVAKAAYYPDLDPEHERRLQQQYLQQLDHACRTVSGRWARSWP